MDLTLQRIDKGTESSIGHISINEGVMSWLECFTCEDEPRVQKLAGKTRIPAGRYEIKLRTEGGKHAHYTDLFPWHEGMLWLQDVPDFEWIYIHIGNTHKHTLGCILTGTVPNHNYVNGGGTVSHSVTAYKRLYLKVIDALRNGPVFITVKDEET